MNEQQEKKLRTLKSNQEVCSRLANSILIFGLSSFLVSSVIADSMITVTIMLLVRQSLIAVLFVCASLLLKRKAGRLQAQIAREQYPEHSQARAKHVRFYQD